MMKSVKFIPLALLLSALFACSDTDSQEGAATEVISFQGNRSHIITRAGDAYDAFDEGTRYLLFAVNTPASDYDWDDHLAGIYNTLATETADHTIDYGTGVRYPANKLDFFGITYGTTTAPDIEAGSATGTTAPQVSITADAVSGLLPDLMVSDNLKGKTSGSGRLQMNFTHTLTKVTFDVMKVESENAADNEALEQVKLESVTINGTYTSGTYDLGAKDWTRTGDATDRLFYENTSGGMAITTDPQDVPCTKDPSASDNSLLIMPNAADQTVSITVTLSGYGASHDQTKTTTYSLQNVTELSDGTFQKAPMQLKQNTHYHLSIMVLPQGVQVVAISPKVYEWDNVTISNVSDASNDMDVMIGKPVVFGDVVWMDRNLGAKTADSENDFYASIGYYYQFGRNVPYIMDTDLFQEVINYNEEKDCNALGLMNYPNNDNSTNWIYNQIKGAVFYPSGTADATIKENAKKMGRVMYTYNQLGEKVYGCINTNKVNGKDPIRFPGDFYTNSDGTVDQENTNEGYKFVYFKTGTGALQDWIYPLANNDGYWTNVSDQPAPKGWRLPTKEDLYSFMPNAQVNWAISQYPQYQTSGRTINNQTHYDNIRYGYQNTSDGKIYRVDMIKSYKIGSEYNPNAYRIRIITRFCHSKRSPGKLMKNRRYILVERFNMETGKKNITDYSQDETDWSNPVASMTFPAAGVIDVYPSSNPVPYFQSFGQGSVLRTSQASSNTLSWVIYLLTQWLHVSVASGNYQSYCDQIRCVRNVNVNE